MLEQVDYGPVQYFKMARSIGGRHMLTTGVYFVDGLLIDTGPSNAQYEFEKVLEAMPVEQVVLTHHHEDHNGNAAFAAERLGVTPLAHPLSLPLLRKPEPVPSYRRVAWGTPAPCEATELGNEISTTNYRFEVLHTPGHAPDHVVLFEPEQHWLFAGDLYIHPRLKVLRADEDVGALIDSLREMLRMPDSLMFCQHGGAHRSHQQSMGAKLDYLLGTQEKATVMHEEGCSVSEIAGKLGLQKRWWKFISRGEFSGENLIAGLLRDADIEI